MTVKLGPASWFILAVSLAGGIAYFGNSYMSSRDIGKTVTAASNIEKQAIKASVGASSQEAATFNLPKAGGAEVRVMSYAWNAQLGLHRAMAPASEANGFVYSGKNSIFGKQDLKVGAVRQDNSDKILAEQLKFAAQVAKGIDNPTEGVHFAIIMGDGFPAYIAGAQDELKKVGQQLEVIGQVGFSLGEDKVMMPPAVRDNPQAARGMTLIGVVPDGDWNIAIQYFNDNDVPINPNVKTYDPDAVNFWKVGDVSEADQLFIAGTCEDRKIVRKGVVMGQTKRVCPEGLVTWTPGDFNAATKRGGVVSIASTRQYRYQMAATVIGVKAWDEKHPLLVKNFLAGAFKGSDVILTGGNAELVTAATVSTAIYKEQSPEYWVKYFKGVTQKDKTGIDVELGGSSVSNLASNVHYFGLANTPDLYEQVYTIYGGYAVHYYPDVVAKLVPYANVVNTTYIKELMGVASIVKRDESEIVDYTVEAQGGRKIAGRGYAIEFESGQAMFKDEALLNSLRANVLTNELVIEIHGHTDNVGNPGTNKALSANRAAAVKLWLVDHGIPAQRIKVFAHGDTQPIISNTTADGRAKNRRVEVKLIG
jgi:outer membrane protein OmpA-like peptidoglycan-associated protein